MDNNELRELEIDSVRETFENTCGHIVAQLTGHGDAGRFAFDYDSVEYLNTWTNACWQSFVTGRMNSK